jgi:hypothetical protein
MELLKGMLEDSELLLPCLEVIRKALLMLSQFLKSFRDRIDNILKSRHFRPLQLEMILILLHLNLLTKEVQLFSLCFLYSISMFRGEGGIVKVVLVEAIFFWVMLNSDCVGSN